MRGATCPTQFRFRIIRFLELTNQAWVQICRLVKLKLLGRVGTSHNSPGQPPEVQNHPKSQKLDFRFGENDRFHQIPRQILGLLIEFIAHQFKPVRRNER
eukprot:sb/3478576/